MGNNIAGTNGQALQEFITNSTWGMEELNKARIQYMMEHATTKDGVLVFDDTGFPKKGKLSVGVARQYSGSLGKVGNCQIAVSCQCTDPRYTWPVNAQVYLPAEWALDPVHRERAKVPEDIGFKTKIQITLDILDQARKLGIKHSVVVADSFYGSNPNFLAGLEGRHETYAVSVPCDFMVRFERDIQTFAP